MSSIDGYKANTAAMAQLTKGINLAMDELKELGFDADANLGRGFDKLELAGLEMGDNGLQDTFAAFCDRWDWGIRALMKDANMFAAMLGLSAGMYHDQEEYAANTFKTVVNQVGGNPYATEEEIKKQSVSDALWSTTPMGHLEDADWSRESIAKSMYESRDMWDQVGEDFETTPWTAWEDDTRWEPDGPVDETFTPKESDGAQAEQKGSEGGQG